MVLCLWDVHRRAYLGFVLVVEPVDDAGHFQHVLHRLSQFEWEPKALDEDTSFHIDLWYGNDSSCHHTQYSQKVGIHLVQSHNKSWGSVLDNVQHPSIGCKFLGLWVLFLLVVLVQHARVLHVVRILAILVVVEGVKHQYGYGLEVLIEH